MFQTIRYRLLLSYLGVLATILSLFAVSVRLIFAQSLIQQLADKLTALAQGAAANAEYENGQFKIEDDSIAQNLTYRSQALQWFNTKNELLLQKGKNVINSPIYVQKYPHIQQQNNSIIAVTLPIVGNDEQKLIGYIRASQSLEEYNETLRKLDWGLASGILTALTLSGLGGIWLTHKAMQPIEESFERLKQFTADASHELRSPLMAIKTNTIVALKYAQGMRESDQEKFEAIVSATQQMTHLTENLLFLARNDKIINRDWTKVNLTGILNQLIQLYKTQAEVKQIVFKINIRNDLYTIGDEEELKRLFINLIDNALHYTLSGGIVEIEAAYINSVVDIKVKDTGIGMTSEEIKKVFERFWRADQARSYDQGKAGLGLSIVKAIVENHQGSIFITSQLGSGSCFTVRLPKLEKTKNC